MSSHVPPLAPCYVSVASKPEMHDTVSYVSFRGCAVSQVAYAEAQKIHDKFEDGGDNESKKRKHVDRLQSAIAKVILNFN